MGGSIFLPIASKIISSLCVLRLARYSSNSPITSVRAVHLSQIHLNVFLDLLCHQDGRTAAIELAAYHGEIRAEAFAGDKR
ncbi:MAG: hypothetical protein LBT59_16420 [Clostridiales bacterium]|nr:hypothetical protein [Clostridiales bacterium]